jgi:tetratricopeptide (TPR) repeat protein
MRPSYFHGLFRFDDPMRCNSPNATDGDVSILQVEDFLSQIDDSLRAAHGARTSSVFTFVLGAGISRGVILKADEVVGDLPRWLWSETKSAGTELQYVKNFWPMLNERLSEESRVELTSNGDPDLNSGDSVSRAYSAAMLRGLATPALRRKYLRHLCAKFRGEVNLAHLYLASLLHAQDTDEWKERYGRFCTTIFTTNFDPLLQMSLQLVSKLYYMTDRPQTLDTPYDDDHQAIHLVYTHGSIHQAALANTEEEIERFAKLQAKRLPSYFKRHGVIVLGYSGWNDACMRALSLCDQFDHNLYWCDVHSERDLTLKLRSNVLKFLHKHRGNAYYVEIKGGDDILQRLHEKLEGNAVPSMIADPLQPLLDRMRLIDPRGREQKQKRLESQSSDRSVVEAFDVISQTIKRIERAHGGWNLPLPGDLSITQDVSTASDEEQKASRDLKSAYFLVLNERYDDVLSICTNIINNTNFELGLRAEARTIRGYVRSRQGNAAGAIADYSAVIDMQYAPVEQRAKAYVNRGITKGLQGDPEGEIADYSAVIDMPGAPVEQQTKALYYRGITKGQQGDLAGAIEDYSAVINLPDLPAEQLAKVYVNRAHDRGIRGDSAGAIADYSAVIKMQDAPPDQRAKAYTGRGFMKTEKGDPAGAIEDYSAAINMPDASRAERVKAIGNRAWAKYVMRQFPASADDSREALSIDPSQTWIRANLGLALLQAGLSDQALTEYQTALAQLNRREHVDEFVIEDIQRALAERPDLPGAVDVVKLAEQRKQELGAGS